MTLTFSAAVFMAFVLAACDQGPAESAGEKVDEAVTETGNAIEDACEDVKGEMGVKNENC